LGDRPYVDVLNFMVLMDLNSIEHSLAVGELKVYSKRTSISFNYYEKLISWAEHGLRHMKRRCEKEAWCNERFKLLEQGMGIFGNALVLCSFYTKGLRVIPEPVVQYTELDCPIKVGTTYDVGILIEEDVRFILLVEVKLYKKSRESIPSFPNVEYIYEDIPKPLTILSRCGAIPLGVLLEANPLPKKAKVPPYVIRVNKIMGRSARKNIYKAIMKWLINKQVIKAKD